MELETSATDKSPDISDAQRVQASGRHVTLTPLHNIEPEPIASEDFTNASTADDPIMTIPSESEDTSTATQPTKTITSIAGLPTRPMSRAGVSLAIGLFIAITCVVLFLLLRT